jgi:hypothetical protein
MTTTAAAATTMITRNKKLNYSRDFHAAVLTFVNTNPKQNSYSKNGIAYSKNIRLKDRPHSV